MNKSIGIRKQAEVMWKSSLKILKKRIRLETQLENRGELYLKGGKMKLLTNDEILEQFGCLKCGDVKSRNRSF